MATISREDKTLSVTWLSGTLLTDILASSAHIKHIVLSLTSFLKIIPAYLLLENVLYAVSRYESLITIIVIITNEGKFVACSLEKSLEFDFGKWLPVAGLFTQRQ